MSSYSDSAPAPEPEPAPEKPKRVKGKAGMKKLSAMTDKQKEDLAKHMEKMKKEGMSPTELKSHRMKMMRKMRDGKGITKSHNEIKKSEAAKAERAKK